MAIYDRSGRRPMPSTTMSLFLAAVAAIIIVSGIYAITHSVGPEANDSASVAQPNTPLSP